ncbi:hypothetical protein R1flu_022562 [Riccia fluitans]|uniref:Uncharacterized protein n=1 Tax=Riccia fluitans TaxID=41844 RepID=A0ABD1XQ40_9MARC
MNRNVEEICDPDLKLLYSGGACPTRALLHRPSTLRAPLLCISPPSKKLAALQFNIRLILDSDRQSEDKSTVKTAVTDSQTEESKVKDRSKHGGRTSSRSRRKGNRKVKPKQREDE